MYDITVPFVLTLPRELGDVVYVQYPGPLASGALGIIVGEQFRITDSATTLQVLV
jgi:hypothetical protein